MKKRISNYTILFTTFNLCFISIGFGAFFKMNKEHEDKLRYAINTKVEYKAKLCYLENNCSGNITLKDLYAKNYLDKIIDPVTKEVLPEDRIIEFVDGNYHFSIN